MVLARVSARSADFFLYKMMHMYTIPGRPSYPEPIIWDLIGSYLEITGELQDVDISPFTGDEAPHIEGMEAEGRGLNLQMIRKELIERTVSKEEGA